jgi:hypothetical protein
MNALPKFVEVAIAGRTLKLSPVKPEHLRPCKETCDRLVAAKGKPLTPEWFKDARDALGFIFICAKPLHPDLTLSELENDFDEMEFPTGVQQLFDALDALGALTKEHFLMGGQ